MKKIIYAFCIIFLTTACNDDALTDLNGNNKNPEQVPVKTLFVSAQKNIVDQMTTPSYNVNIFRLVNQHWTETTYIDESIYNWTSRKVSDNHWRNFYALPLADLTKAKQALNQLVIPSTETEKIAEKNNQLMLIDILMVYSYNVLVDTFGDVPYTDALLGSENYLPKYDKAIDIYKDLIIRLDKDIAGIDTNYGAFGTSDLICQDNLTKWVKFANSLKLKIAINLKASGLESSIADTAILSAASNIITNNSENIKFAYQKSGPNSNPIFQELSVRNDFVVTETIVNHLVNKNDPRVNMYFDDNIIPYKGGVIGMKNTYSKFTHVSDKIKMPDFPATLFDLAEIEFLLAEAVERNVAVGGTAEEHYTKAITASMQDWGISESLISSYLSQPSVNYATATGTWQQKIGEQAWYALYNRGFEGYTSTRRLNFPALSPPPNADANAKNQIPSRMQYPIREQTLNPTSYSEAAASIGGDHLYTKLFWDLN